MAEQNLACVQVFSDINSPEKCGYCQKTDSHYLEGGIWSFDLSPQHEQYLLDYAWRRCGKFIYVVDKVKNCCPLYMIRLDVERFSMSHSQKKVLRRFTNYLKGSSKAKTTETSAEEGACHLVEPAKETTAEPVPVLDCNPQKKSPRKGMGPDPTKGPCLKAKERRKQNKKASEDTAATVSKATQDKHKGNIEKTLEEYLNEHKYIEGYAHKFETKLVLVNPESAEYKASEAETHRIYQAYQVKVHQDPPGKNTLKQYKDFLVTSSVKPHDGYGCYHLQYCIDGKIFMVGVLDILQNYVSSVYTFYDPDFMFLSPGVFSALNEIALTRKIELDRRVKQWYCMGFYSHAIQKMCYKGEYSPSFLNCPFTHNWIPFDKCTTLLETGKYQRLDNTDRQAEPVESYMNSALIHYKGTVVPYSVIAKKISKTKNDESAVREYCELVGPDFCRSAIAIFNFSS